MTREVPTMIRTARLAQVLEHALRAPSVHNTQPWRWRLGGDVIDLFADVGRQLPVTDPDGRDLTISCGAALHHLVVALGHAGHDACVRRMPDPQDNTHLATITISDEPPDPAAARLFGAIARRHTELHRMRCQPVPVALQAALVDAARRFDVRMVRANGVREAFNNAFAAAAERELWTNGHTTALHISGPRTGSRHGGRDSRVVGPRPGLTGMSDSRGFGYSELELPGPPLGYRLPDDGAEFFLLATREDRTQDRLRAGQALSSVLLTATQAGLATTPLSRGLEMGTHHLAVGETATPQIFVRVGWPTVRASGQSPSVRRDLATVLMRPVDLAVDAPVEAGAAIR
jgi:hypothetical protein